MMPGMIWIGVKSKAMYSLPFSSYSTRPDCTTLRICWFSACNSGMLVRIGSNSSNIGISRRYTGLNVSLTGANWSLSPT
ncbi:hypothetical protein D3C87_1794510 [compost metagenome]